MQKDRERERKREREGKERIDIALYIPKEKYMCIYIDISHKQKHIVINTDS